MDLCYSCGRTVTLTDPDYSILEPRPNNLDAPLRPLAETDSTRLYWPGPDTPYHSATQVIRYNPDSSVATLSRYAFREDRDTTWAEGAVLSWTGGRLSRVYTRRYNRVMAAWDTLSVRFIEYSPAGLVTLDSLSGSTVVRYTYDAAGRYITRRQTDLYGNPPYVILSDSNVYDASDRLLLRFYREYNQPLNIYRYYNDSFAYTPGLPGFSAHFRYYVDPATGAPDGREAATITNRINAMNRADSITTYSGPAGVRVPVTAYRLVFNSNGNPLRKETWSHSTGATPWMSAITSYRYAPLSGPSTRSSTAVLPGPIQVGPNPSSGCIQLRSPGHTGQRRLRVRISTCGGQLLLTEQFRMDAGAYQLCPGSMLAPGPYLLQVADERGTPLFSGIIERR